MKIESYSFGLIKIGGQEFKSDLTIYPGHVNDKWWRKEGHLLQMEDLTDILALKPEVLIVGQGLPGLMQVDQKVEEYCRGNGIRLLVMPTEKAVEEYNNSSGKKEKVVACLHLTC
ncbi:Mth938-like domain-containing protein [candidate division TA06 bacterium]|nr:Mth938-like domain-containing protein [candidate division TA06 bacterium]